MINIDKEIEHLHGKRVTLYWTGGVDSNGILAALLNINCKVDLITISSPQIPGSQQQVQITEAIYRNLCRSKSLISKLTHKVIELPIGMGGMFLYCSHDHMILCIGNISFFEQYSSVISSSSFLVTRVAGNSNSGNVIFSHCNPTGML